MHALANLILTLCMNAMACLPPEAPDDLLERMTSDRKGDVSSRLPFLPHPGAKWSGDSIQAQRERAEIYNKKTTRITNNFLSQPTSPPHLVYDPSPSHGRQVHPLELGQGTALGPTSVGVVHL